MVRNGGGLRLWGRDIGPFKFWLFLFQHVFFGAARWASTIAPLGLHHSPTGDGLACTIAPQAFYVLMFTCFLLNITVPIVISWWKAYYCGEKHLPYL